jgi:hypothetical protein
MNQLPPILTKMFEQHETTLGETLTVLRAWKAQGAKDPLFAMPDDTYAVFADIAGVGHQLARNEAAHNLVRRLKLIIPFPTVMMLRQCLIEVGIPFDTVKPTELGIDLRQTELILNPDSANAIPPCRCPHCGLAVDVATSIGHHDTPQPGSLMVCIRCKKVSEFTADLTLRAMPEAEWRTLPSDQISSIESAIATIGG